MSKDFWLAFYFIMALIGLMGASTGLLAKSLLSVAVGAIIFFVNTYWLHKEYMKIEV
jgi:hypothetical protein